MSLRMVSPLTWLMLSACIQPVGLGPDMGPCAAPPDGAYTFGEVGIGTCLAGPTDMQFVQIDGKDWLLVSNSDPFENFSSGSLLVVDWQSVDPSEPTQLLHTLNAASTTLPRSSFDPDDDLAGDRYLGSIGLVVDRPDGVPLALVPSRYSGESITTDTQDYLRVVDLTDPTNPTASAEFGDGLLLGGDPTQVAVVGDRAFVSHLFDQDLAVIDVHASPIERVLVGSGAAVLADTFVDGDDSGSSATLSFTEIVTPSLFVDERWTLTRVDASWRVWVPEAGLQRWEVGHDAVVVAPTGPDLPLTDSTPRYTGAFAALDASGNPALLFGQDGNIRQAQVSTSTLDLSDWIVSSDVLLRAGTGNDAWNAFIDAPSVADSPNGEDAVLAYDGRLAQGEPASIGIAIAQASGDETNLFVKRAQPALVPGEGLSLEDPFVRSDVYLGGLRMWLSETDGAGTWRILESRSGDGISWADPVGLTGLPESASNPVVDWINGRYILWFTQWTGDAWSLSRAESDDGLDFRNVVVVRPIDGADDPLEAPRPAVLTNAVGGYSLVGNDVGRAAGLVVDGVTATSLLTSHGLVFETASGYVLDGPDVSSDLAANGIAPGALFEVDGVTKMLATATGEDSLRRIIALKSTDAGWELDGDALIDLDETGLTETFDPVIAGSAGAWTLWFAAPNADGTNIVRRATSADASSWSLAEEAAFSSQADFARDGSLPGSVQTLSNGDVRLWFTGVSREQVRIGTAISTDGGETFLDEPGPNTPWQLGPGLPGTFDDNGLRDPRLVVIEDRTYLLYAGLDGDISRLGIAELLGDADDAGPWRRHEDLTGTPDAWLPAVTGTFCSAGHDHPVVLPTEDGRLRVWFAGRASTGLAPSRIGSAIGTFEALFAEIRYPTHGDTLSFSTVSEAPSEGNIELVQRMDRFTTSGSRISRLQPSEDGGQLLVTSSSSTDLLILDVRSDDTRDALDANVNDIEALLRVPRPVGGQGLRDVVQLPGTDILYASGGTPDAVLVIDASAAVDDNLKQAYDDVLLDALPMRSAIDDAGADGIAALGGGAMALRNIGGQTHLFVPHFRDNSVTVYDLNRGAYGEAVGYIPFLGENPHMARLTPDGKHVLVANYLGAVDDGFVSSTISVIDADPASPTFLTVVTTLVNR